MIYHLKNVSNDYLLLLQYLQEIDNDFEISLSQKVNLEEYVYLLAELNYKRFMFKKMCILLILVN